MIIGNPELGFRLGIRSQKPITLFNGALECKLLRFTIEEKAFFEPKAKSQQERIEHISRGAGKTSEVKSAIDRLLGEAGYGEYQRRSA